MSFGRWNGILVGAVLVSAAAACGRNVNLDKVPVGSEVTLTRQDGGVVKGPLEKVDAQTVVLKVGNRSKTVPRAQISDARVEDPAVAAQPLPPAAKFREFVVAAGTPIHVRLMTAVASNTSHAEDQISAELAQPIMVDSMEVAPAGSSVTGTVLTAQPSAKVKGLASIALKFESLRAGADTYSIGMTYSRSAQPTKGSDAKKIGIPAAGGALLGAILGGKKGALIGGAVGGGAGTAVVLSTSGKEVVIPAGTELTLTLDRDIEIKVPIK